MLFPKTMPFAERLQLVARGPDECWPWPGQLERLGYARASINGKKVLLHVAAYELLVGPIPEGMELDHLCRTRSCVNPRHLEPVTHRINVMRGRSFSRFNAEKTHCLRGHPLSGQNLRRYRGGRYCLACEKRHNKGPRTHCRHGHLLSPENVGVNNRGHRYCRECGRAHCRRRRAA